MPLQMGPQDIVALYNLHRAYAEHENHLINHRVSWCITIQSFVIATFGLSIHKKFEVAVNIASDTQKIAKLQPEILEFDIFLLFLTVVGFVVALVTLYSVIAATESISSINGHWNRTFQDNGELAKLLPPIVGGGHPKSGIRGQWLSWSLPVFFVGFWVVVGIFIIASVFGITHGLFSQKVLLEP